jgi:chemotaxis methyl-accepting protein methylase
LQDIVERFSHVRFAASTAGEPRLRRKEPSRLQAEDVLRQAPPVHVPVEERAFIYDILRKARLEPANYRISALSRRLSNCLRVLKAHSIAEASASLAAHQQSFQSLLNTLLIGVTGFFRDVEAYGHLRHVILPSLLRTSPTARVLSAACSDGAELYSLAMCLAEHNALAGATFVGVDCRQEALDGAAKGWYGASAMEAVPLPMQNRFFRREGEGHRIIDSLRDAIDWQQNDIFHFSTPAPFDLIACRNVAIYLEPRAAERLWQHLHASLGPGGILFTGKAERPNAGFQRIAPCFFKKVCSGRLDHVACT